MKNSNSLLWIFFALQLLLPAGYLFAQPHVFVPRKEETKIGDEVFTSLEKRCLSEISQLKGGNKKQLEKIYKERWENIREKFSNKHIFFQYEGVDYLDAVVGEIMNANPLLAQLNVKCYFSRSGIPNAEYLGEGLILVNMGLVTQLQNESQLAFILAHELAHCYLKHSENNIAAYVDTINSKEIQLQLKNIKKATYGKRAELENLLKGLTFNSRRHGRLHETEADSMAVEIIRNTRFNMQEAISTLGLASSVSDFYSQHQIALMVKMTGGFDYEFTTGEADNSDFTVCYSTYEKSAEYKGQTFNSIRYNGSKFNTDKIELKSKASRLKVFPAKPGSVMIMEYFKKEKRLDFRLERLG